MTELVAKRYVKALLETFGERDLKLFSEVLSKIGALYGLEKFIAILNSPDVKKEEKLNLLLFAVENGNEKMINFIKILAHNNRLLFIPHISKELQREVSQRDGIFEGEIVSDSTLTKKQIEDLEKSFGKKFGSTIKLNARKTNYAGLKISVDGLGIEASFSVDRLKAQMREHILKAI